MRFGAVGADAASLAGEDDAAHLEDPDAHHNNMILTASRHIGAQGSRMLSALFEGLEADFFSLVIARSFINAACRSLGVLGRKCRMRANTWCRQVDLVSKSHQLLCMPMLGVTLAWKQRLAAEAPAAPLLPLLDQCGARLLQHYSAVLRDRVDAIARCAATKFGLYLCSFASNF